MTENGERTGSRYREKRKSTGTENSGQIMEIQVKPQKDGKGSAREERTEVRIDRLVSLGKGSPGSARGIKKKDGSAADGKEEDWQEKLYKRRIRKAHRILLCFAGVLTVVYAAAAVYFSSHFYAGSSIYGIDCSQMTVQEAKNEVKQKLKEKVLTIKERRNAEEVIRADEIDLALADNGSIDRMMKAQRSYLWPVMCLLDRPDTSAAFTYDREKVKAIWERLDCCNDILAIRPRDAYIEGTPDGFVVIPEETGTTLEKGKALKTVFAALDRGEDTVSFEEEGCYLNPTVYRDDKQLNQDAAAMNELVSARITYDFADRKEVLDATVMQDWIVKLDDGTFAVDDAKAELYVEALAKKYDTFGMEREFYTSYGTVVSLYGGDYGWAIDQAATLRQLLDAIGGKEDVTLEPVYLYTAMSREENDIGYTYVEICISQQRMICYKDGNVVADTPVVTGNPNRGNATPSGGVWAIDAKMRSYVLRGEGYTTPVDYWMPFNGDIGIHDLKARAYFGGSIYLTNGSHGCVNTPYDQVQIIYDAVSVGTPVIVYDSP